MKGTGAQHLEWADSSGRVCESVRNGPMRSSERVPRQPSPAPATPRAPADCGAAKRDRGDDNTPDQNSSGGLANSRRRRPKCGAVIATATATAELTTYQRGEDKRAHDYEERGTRGKLAWTACWMCIFC
ncbi:hypothetical protein AAFF_G00339800 [Aldrovandia affinis]|uniref:Uncharacterized protein n=1 Tax=Aldrovandia affinis TaxID=143900 RepID=A0AAD7SKA6_9TELE|nr:hypothetical protein AAFF_G00339800 [Aldrovandia affinis]